MGGIRAAELHRNSELLFAANDSVLVRWGWDTNGEASMRGYLPPDDGGGWKGLGDDER